MRGSSSDLYGRSPASCAYAWHGVHWPQPPRSDIRPFLLDETARFDHGREDTFHLPFSTSGEEPDEVTFAIDANLFLGERLQQGMSREDCVKSARFYIGFSKGNTHIIRSSRRAILGCARDSRPKLEG